MSLLDLLIDRWKCKSPKKERNLYSLKDRILSNVLFFQRGTTPTWPTRGDSPEVWEELFQSKQSKSWQKISFFFLVYLNILSSSVETLLPSPDSAFQLGDFFPMVKVPQKLKWSSSEIWKCNHSCMKSSCNGLLWSGCWVPLCGHQTKSVGVSGGEDKWRGGGAGREKSLLEGLAHWSRDCRGFPSNSLDFQKLLSLSLCHPTSPITISWLRC